MKASYWIRGRRKDQPKQKGRCVAVFNGGDALMRACRRRNELAAKYPMMEYTVHDNQTPANAVSDRVWGPKQ